MNFLHIPVMKSEVINALALKNGATIVDATVGGAGHSKEIAKHIKSGTLICIDQDNDALCASWEELNKINDVKVSMVHANFVDIREKLDELGILKVDGIMADLGVSSFQIDEISRGFSYTKDAPLDMRMNRGQKLSASEVVNEWREEELKRIIENFGEERYSGRIASAIVNARPIQTTGQLSEIIKSAVPEGYGKTGGHPAKRTFQAIRIAVNNELAILEKFINDSVEVLSPKGRLVMISFHSLEDRIIKQAFKRLATDCVCPPKTPICICGHKATVKILTKKPIEPTAHEIKENPRAASAKIRVIEKL
ncbi:MAG: 16S rRNA (cytosine(1402)-N(4))-methyltransferase RsmH [Christensenellaceae bacterium]|nr:16S rRNA (cytosine(1402)-N(4))-methyltransferase RsmH [Christensenellaceae bacterium]